MQINESLPVGTMLDGGSRKYEIKSVLGHGGFGITYLATSTICIEKIPVEVQFAIKEHYISSMNERQGASVSVPNASNTAEVQESIDSFLVEAQRLGRLCDNHPGIVRVNESFRANGTAYYVMEYIKGRSLRDYIKQMPQGRLPEKEALELFRPIIETIAYLHENKVTHLDIKPDNILIRESGEPVIIDFGLSKHYNAKGTPTSTIKAAGCSAGYSPMEQYAGITTFTPEADIYALAATLLYMLTGKDPIISTEINEQIIRQSIPEGVSTETTNAILMAMRKLKEDRTHRVREFSDGLVAKVQKAESVVVQDIPQQKPVRDNNQTQKIQAASQEKTPQKLQAFSYNNRCVMCHVCGDSHILLEHWRELEHYGK
jgi:Serine/threonine protein kinase